MHSTKAIKVCSVSDMAVDDAAMGRDVGEYIRTRRFELLRFVDGAKPAVFHVGRIHTRTQMEYVDAAPSDSARLLRAFEVGVLQIDDLVTVDGEVRQVVTPQDTLFVSGSQVPRFSAEQIDEIAPAYITEIGAVAYARSQLGKASEASYPLPPSSLAVWTRKAGSRIADATGGDPSSLSSGAQAEPRER